jgi:hypothetical protein
VKIKKFAKEYIAKVLHKLRRAQRERGDGNGEGPKGLPPLTDSANTSVAGASATPDSRDDVDVGEEGDGDVDMADEALAEVMDVDNVSGSVSAEENGTPDDKMTVMDPRVRARGRASHPPSATIAVS